MASVPARKLSRDAHRQRVHARVRQKITGTAERPRLSVYRSVGHIYVQVIDDRGGHTIVSASSVDKETKKGMKGGGNIAAAKAIGQHDRFARGAANRRIKRVFADFLRHRMVFRVKAK